MVRWTADNKVYIKIVYWGPDLAGKKTILDTLQKLIKEQDKDIIPIEPSEKNEMAKRSTLYLGWGISVDFKERSTKKDKVFYHVYTIAGRSKFSPIGKVHIREKKIRQKILLGIDGVIFVFDSRKSQLTENTKSLKELNELAKGNLVKKIPLIIMLNKQDLSDTVSKAEVEQILRDEGLMFEPEDPLYIWNPVIFETIGLYDKQKNVYETFMECAYRTKLYLEDKKSTKTARINLTLTEELKNEWEIFARDVLNKSMSQMIRDAVREYRNKYIQSEEVQDTLEVKIEKIISEKIEKMMENYKLRETKIEKIISEKMDKIYTGWSKYDILLIDPHLPTIRLLTSYFESKGYLCKGVISGTEGLEELKNATPKLILLENILPDLSGYDLCKVIKSNKKTKDIPIYFLTAIPGSEIEKKLEETKADGYILKPFDFSDFEDILKFMEKFKLSNMEEEKKYYEVDPYSEFIDLTMKWKELKVKLMNTKDPEENRKLLLQLIGISERMKNMTEVIYKKDRIRLMELEGLEFKNDKDTFKNLTEQIDKLNQKDKK